MSTGSSKYNLGR